MQENEKKTWKKYTTEEIIVVLREVKNGFHPYDAEKKYNIPAATIIGWCKKAGIPFERRPRVKRDWDAIRNSL